MATGRREMLRELAPTLQLAGPVILAELGWMAMGIVDTMIVGRLGAEAIGAVSIGGTFFLTVAVFGMGMLLGLDTLIAQAFGAGRLADCRRTLTQGVYLGLALTLPLTGLVFMAGPWLNALGVNPAIIKLATPYIRAIAWSMGPLLVYAAFRRYLQAVGRLTPIVFALISANLINALANWVLVYGHLGAPAWGVEGSGWATTVSRIYMALVVVIAAVIPRRSSGLTLRLTDWRPDLARIRQLLALGFPAAAHLTLEVGVFATATTLVGRLDSASLAAHQIVLNVASVTFMIPLGLASAAAVLVGRALGRRDPVAAVRAGWTAIVLGAGFMTCSGLTFLLIPRSILGAFTTDPTVVATGLTLLGVAACFQLFDGLQGVTTGVLRGVGDTRTPMLVNLLAHWALGLPCGYALAFPGGLGALGLWIGLSIGLVAAGLTLLRVWFRQARRLRLTEEQR
ncbi:multidrug resistance protein, MATE family [Singulisphaera sp. GP187]|uniref:MATE family efflux transporter n=1 Tax=Singulisphaera sp. GP187 TaxID=1882752 RepID=UPI00092BA9C3|nr:MATE family efflux transporter [Singulisphaera sp. GP187]SIO56931.1 multidrug resistance protein, MATE family [Singulisphaera sp. GP187]